MLIFILYIHQYEFPEFNAMSYRYTIEEILQFSNVKFMNFSITSLVWNTTNEVHNTKPISKLYLCIYVNF